MLETLKKPYEISLWQDALMTVPDGERQGETYYQEQKVMIIGSDKMDSPNKVFNPVLKENINGEKTLTFSLLYRYNDPATDEIVINPFHKYLINERKVKLFYDDKWYDFVIKECEESDQEYTFNYTAVDQLALELGKVGYNVTFSTDLNNNQGTVTELGAKTLESTDWQVDTKNSDLLQQTIKEPVYKCKVTRAPSASNVINVNTGENVELETDEVIYVFYSYVANKNGEFVQFVREKDRNSFEEDDDFVITTTNYRLLLPCAYTQEQAQGLEQYVSIIGLEDFSEESENGTITIDELYNDNQFYRLVFGQLTTYDPITQRTVNIYEVPYKDSIQQIYNYTDYEYTISTVLTSYVSNGSDFNVLQDGTLQNWSAATPTTNKKEGLSVIQSMSVATYPPVQDNDIFSLIRNYSQIKGYLELNFTDVFNRSTGENTFFNSGIEDNASTIDHIAAGEQYVLRLRYGYANERQGELQPYNPITDGQGVRAVVAKYTMDTEEYYEGETKKKLHLYKMIPDSILFDFNGDFVQKNSYITGGRFTNNYSDYEIDNVIQTPSSKYCYKEEGNDTEYVWDSEASQYVPKENAFFMDYYMTTAPARYSVSNTVLSDPTTNIGIFLYTEDSNLVGENKYVYIEDIQITKLLRDKNGEIVTLGNVPTAVSEEHTYYYLKPSKNRQASEINMYSTLDYLAYEMGIPADRIKPVYNDKCEKILSIEESQSNCFNILQSLCETFECWLDLEVWHNDDGTFWLDDDYKPRKLVRFKKYAGKDNFAGFKYGINLQSIQRSIDSNEFVTKLIVDNVSSEYVDGGSLSIQNAQSNPSKESYILDFSYYLRRGLIANKDECNADLNEFYADLNDLNQQLYDLQQDKIDLESALVKLRSNRTVFEELIENAQSEYTEALVDFEKITNIDYFDYVEQYNQGDETAVDLATNESVIELISKIYICATTIDKYSGLITNLQQEYDAIQLQLEGAKEYGITITTVPATEETPSTTQITIDDFLDGFTFAVLNDDEEVEFTSSMNNRIFTATARSMDLNFTKLFIKKKPDNYWVEFYVNNEAHIIDDTDNISFRIYDDDQEGVLIRRITLIPSKEYRELYTGIYRQIEEVQKLKAEREKKFYEKYSRFIQEGTWSSKDYIDPELYYLDALQVGRTSAQPKVSYQIDVVEVSELEGLENYFFHVGDRTFIEDEEFFGRVVTIYDGNYYYTPNKEEVIVSEVEWHLDKPDENVITVQNYKTRFEDLFQRVSATVQTLQYNEVTYPKISTILGANGLIDRELLMKSWNEGSAAGYTLTSDGTVSIDGEGILVQDLTNSSNLVKIINRGVKTSTDGGKTWLNVIDAYGVNAESLNAGTINTNQIWIMDNDNPSFRWDSAGISAYGLGDSEEEPYDLKTFVRFDKYGLYGIQNGENYIANSLEDIKKDANFGITWDGFFIKNSYDNGYVSITSDDDFQVVSTDVNREITAEQQEVKQAVFQVIDGQMTIAPYDIVEVLNVEENTEEDSSGVDYMVSNGIVTILSDEVLEEYKVTYRNKLNFIDLGGDGIIEVDSVVVNGTELDKTAYNYDSTSGILIFKEPLSIGDLVQITHKLEHIKIGAIEFDDDGAPSKYGIKIKNKNGDTVFESNDDGNLTVTGTINATDGVFRGTVYATGGEFNGHIRATSGEFPGSILVGDSTDQYITIDGSTNIPYIASSDYLNDDTQGWIVLADGDAIFNNVSVRGAIKTSVFEYSEIQAVGGAFLFRPSVVIKKAELRNNSDGTSDVVVTLEQKDFFKVGDWCKLSNYLKGVENGDTSSLMMTGLAAIYKVIEVWDDGRVVLQGAGELFE